MRPASEALAFRIWQFCQPREWDVTVNEIAEAVGASAAAVSAHLRHRGWLGRIRGASPIDVYAYVGPSRLRSFDNSLDGGSYRQSMSVLIPTMDDEQ